MKVVQAVQALQEVQDVQAAQVVCALVQACVLGIAQTAQRFTSAGS